MLQLLTPKGVQAIGEGEPYRANRPMSRIAPQLLEEARQLPAGDLDWLIQNLLSEGDEGSEGERFAAW